MTIRLAVARTDLRALRWTEAPAKSLDDGEVRLRVDTFALTSNNITYAAFGDAMNYWQFFPTGDPGTGCIPVWGFASVIESRCPGVEVGERFYGYWPIGDEAVLQATDVHPGGFTDGAEHRRALHAIYNQYVRCSTDPGYVADREAQQALLRPLFATSFLIDDFLVDNQFFGATTVVLSSASSKTAYGTAFCLARRRGRAEAVSVVGLTSPANAAFTRSLGCYDDMVCYEDVATSLPEVASVYVDFSGDAAVRAAVHRRLGDRLAYSCAVGGTHWDAMGGGGELPGPAPVLFFAPDQVRKRAADWGPTGLQERMAEAWTAFMAPVTNADHPWLTVVTGQGQDAVEHCYTALLDGAVPAHEGHILSV
ncbi:DUF2855 family protein [Mycolicibacterium sphagni]|uniref:DUF2855 domain-containing protein n=1 Tax=Mycolicibacterium sphagni TaxID=1786 RepID=A0A255DD71_9MYCO|nr:DUF2855 family protein [Mycolicibacterium sphagni]OYN77060.1 hypothetical protein CG716_19605 [Mycolicibacterium sphagni]